MEEPFIRTHFRKVAIAFVLIVIAALWIFFGPAKQALKSWRASGLVEEAQGHAEAKEWEEVYRIAMASLQNEESLEALRLFAKAAVKTGDPRNLELAYSLFRYPGATPEDRCWVLSRALDVGDHINAPRLVSLLTPEESRVPAIHYQLVRERLFRKDYQEAVTLADDPAMTSRDPAVDLLLAESLAGSGRQGAREATTARLRTLLNAQDRDLALRAMTFLAFLNDQWISEPLAQAALDRFQDDPDLSVSAKLTLELFRIGLKERPIEEAMAQAITEYRESDLLVLVQWLARLKQDQKMITLTEDGQVQENATVFALRLQALENLERWAQIDTELVNPVIFFPEPLLWATRAVVSARLGEDLPSGQRWQKAMAAAKRDQDRNWFYELVKKAKQLGDPERVMETVIAGIKHPLGSPPKTTVLAPLFQWLKDRGDGKRLLEVSAILLRREPDNPVLLNNYSYLKAVHEIAKKDEAEVMQALVSRYPEQENFRNTLAFILLSMGDAKACLEVLDETLASPGEFSNIGKAIYAKALFERKKKEQALALAKSIDWGEISDEERKKLEILGP